MRILTDWHIHTPHSCDCQGNGSGVPMADVVALVRNGKMAACGVSDHIHTPYNLPDLVASRAMFDALPWVPDFHFGVEASCVSQWELDRIAAEDWEPSAYGIRSGGPAGGPLALGVTDEQVLSLDIEYVIGGVHWPMFVPMERDAVIRDYHRQYMFLAAHPLVDILAHPWWWMGHWATADGRYLTDPWLDDFGKVPLSMHDELAACLREHDVAFEINFDAILCNERYPDSFCMEYLDYVAYLHERGVRFSLGSDAHGGDIRRYHDEVASQIAYIGLKETDFWTLPARTFDDAP